ncbi:hypothetical protein FGSG_11105 [Fusarium graminearum PH-1]|uniref:Chromosome 3, complete genome n=1 Tax=Gibberella zeae (strain ATCC MYA-4620 / CBS 123657 / FGSC 9075 / NRRL 31084 / PH-1) TaxID=229533 RepID=I1S2V2_GIBZE|nr:hypothetical protein FGSG_11105 [Fusarium graminearum PH-1]ESU17630.1 hypothetical protein FGSG_11105 [Fusarium graminearum PH-1]EYB29083.1 hypothetical protein FG05_11105 [Fusarium graminearum]CEF88828.1 unnamed protein product [Fusarium graminearum]|eukprot:XP_011325252.1 hypothetical protein FGSG_11105 [Fusarium graminearum PH-1]
MQSYETDLDDYAQDFVAIGIDFGTTYSGISWAFSGQPKEVHQITDWPSDDHRNHNEIQVPTLYDIDSRKWGYEITPDMKPIKWFKLLLLNNDDITKEDIRNAKQLQEARSILAKHGNITAVQIVGRYLKKIWDHTYAALRSRLDIDDLPIRVAITIPAIWPGYAENAMKEAARIAGILDNRVIGDTTLMLVQEPEAAALACLFQRNSSPEIKMNESFVVCDAGGGTVDVISYKVVSEKPFMLDECATGAGMLSGAFLIDEAFNAYLRFQAKLRVNSIKDSDFNQFILREWEHGAKRSFSISQHKQFYFLHPPMKAYGRFDRLMNKDTLKISNEEMTNFFNRSLTGIRTLVGKQHEEVKKKTGKPPKKILLVGGLGSSEYVYDTLTAIFSNTVLRPIDGWSAVARGAVLRLLQENISSQGPQSIQQQEALNRLPVVLSRQSRYHYGIQVNKPVKNLDYDSDDEVTTDPEGTKVTSRITWYLSKGDSVGKQSRIPFSYHKFCRVGSAPSTCTFDILYSAHDPAPKRVNSQVSTLCRIECDWDKPISEWKAVGDPSKGWRKHDDLELTMGLEGVPKWEIRVGSKKREHSFRIDYVE